MPKIAEVKFSSCGLEVADFGKNCDCGIAVAEEHFFKSCGIAIAEVLPSSCGIAIADSKKKLRVPTSDKILLCMCTYITAKKNLKSSSSLYKGIGWLKMKYIIEKR
jgi:hypothetical protein